MRYSFEEVLKTSFVNYQFTNGGKKVVYPTIFLKNNLKIRDIRVGCYTYTLGTSEQKHVPGETIEKCLSRHGVSVRDIKKVVMSCFDMTDSQTVHEKFTWTEKNGWIRNF